MENFVLTNKRLTSFNLIRSDNFHDTQANISLEYDGLVQWDFQKGKEIPEKDHLI